ncbi:MAG: hypothetical protein GY952_12035, partial [Rhodobacteraceae bacterium]|nr:hypothetical protein [Paracoccaceae bacterium]
AQMMAFVEQQKVANQGIAISMAGLSNLIGQFGIAVDKLVRALPAVSVQGGGAGISGGIDITPQGSGQ